MNKLKRRAAVAARRHAEKFHRTNKKRQKIIARLRPPVTVRHTVDPDDIIIVDPPYAVAAQAPRRHALRLLGAACPKCGKEDQAAPHYCPFQSEINDNRDDDYCRCCIACVNECARDI